ncbi:hypothetical protein FA95DRAFT_1677629 [Auriscalpium vulgare]|uniref:Uncharacterized protein n=1 Tax=Auriscalpium vulgare TaxID=40419 RepID=A0ACB8RYW8_9AGAM|nr:hypothetical protein FA95DRAFT_1677629 [Auriscalpium vulgare]
MASPLPKDPFAGIAWDNKLGALLIGGLVSGVLFGITCMQSYTYFDRYPGDRWHLKTFVGALWVLDAFDFALTSDILYWYLVTNYTNPYALLGKPVWSLAAHVLVTSVVNFMDVCPTNLETNMNIILTAGIVLTSMLDLVVGFIITAKTLHFVSLDELSTESTLFYIDFAAGAGSDIYVAVALSYYLARSRTGFNTRTDSIVNILLLYTINTGLLTAADATLGMILYIAMPDNFIFIAFYFQLSKLYTNAYLATLNNRNTLREKTTDSDGIVSIHLSRMTQPSRGAVDAERTAYSEPAKSEIKSKNVLITGASLGGLGGGQARQSGDIGGSKPRETVAFIKGVTPTANLRTVVLDLNSLASVKAAAATVNSCNALHWWHDCSDTPPCSHIVAAFDPTIKGQSGAYLADCQVHNDQVAPHAVDQENYAAKLWALAEKVVGQTFA